LAAIKRPALTFTSSGLSDILTKGLGRQAIATTASIDPKDLKRPGHREENPMTVAGVIEYLAGHVRLHAVQTIESRRVIWEKG